MIEYEQAEDFTPDPISLLESNRNLGYSIEEAVSDLIDNSITAFASEIRYEIHWNEGAPFFTLFDNGKGISIENNDLIDSFKLGSTNPLTERDPEDLGRFGFGMKTASLSQARILNVISKTADNNIASRALDLDYINSIGKWNLRYCDEDRIIDEINYLDKIVSGTVIKWENWDRAPNTEEDFTSLISDINNYISVCFHRFIERGIKIFCHSTELESCSPIPSDEGAEEYSKVHLSKNKDAVQTAYILQHPKKWEEDFEVISRFNSFRLFEGFERQQGIYIYRCDRLLTPKAGWLGLLRKGNAAKLARVVIDYPNNADAIWSLDITKTNASIPYEFKREIKKIIDAAKNASIKKIVRGSRETRNNLEFKHSQIWNISNNKIYNSYKYSVDFEHPFFKHFIEEKKIKEKDLFALLSIISDSLPVAEIIKNNDANPSKHDRMMVKEKLTDEDLKSVRKIFQYQCSKMKKAEAFSWLLSFEPYRYYEYQLKEVLL